MFQYAVARSLSIMRHTSVLLDLSHLENTPKNESIRSYELNVYKVKAKISHQPVELEPPRNIFGKRKQYRLIVEQGFPFKPEVLDLPNYSLLEGYWQCEKYFLTSKAEIRKDFSLKTPLSPSKQRTAEEIASAPQSISLHIRRGDYVSDAKTKEFHGALSIDYYQKAVMRLASTLNNLTIFVFSDDPKWCSANIRFNYNTVYIENMPGLAHEDMFLMSHCHHHIIANSSFSWWGAWLSPDPKKIVIAPKVWFQEQSADYSDIVPSNWEKM